jgi:hypothetical protein
VKSPEDSVLRKLRWYVDGGSVSDRQVRDVVEIMEAIWVAAEMRAGGAFAHSVIALEAMAEAAHR